MDWKWRRRRRGFLLPCIIQLFQFQSTIIITGNGHQCHAFLQVHPEHHASSSSSFPLLESLATETTPTIATRTDRIPSQRRRRTRLSFAAAEGKEEAVVESLVDDDPEKDEGYEADDDNDNDDESDGVVDNDNDAHFSELDDLYRQIPGSGLEFRDKLEQATLRFLDSHPLGTLTADDVEMIAGLMAAWARQGTVDAARTAERLLRRVVDEVQARDRAAHGEPHDDDDGEYHHYDEGIVLTTRLYTLVMDAWGRCRNPERCNSIHEMLVKEYSETKNEHLAPNLLMYHAAMNAWTKSHHPEAHVHTERLFQQLLDQYQEGKGNVQLKPTSNTMAIVMDAYSRSRLPAAVKRSWALFHLVDTLGLERSVYSYAALQNVVAKSRRPHRAQECRAILRKMQRHHRAFGEFQDFVAKPAVLNYNNIMNACARTGTRRAAEMAFALLHEMDLSDVAQANGSGNDEDDVDDDDKVPAKPSRRNVHTVAPDKLTFALCILACARGDRPAYAVKALEMMEAASLTQRIQRQEASSVAPATVVNEVESFNVVLVCLAKYKEYSPGFILSIIQRMQEYAKENPELAPQPRSWNAVLNSLSLHQGLDRNGSQARQARKIINYLRGQYPRLSPNIYSYTSILSTIRKSNDPKAPEVADEILAEMVSDHAAGRLESPPDVYHYTITCSIWARSGNPRAPQRVLDILGDMLATEDSRPNMRTYNSVLDCLARQAPLRAEELLYYLLDSRRLPDGPTGNIALENFTFNTVIYGLCRSRLPDAGRRAESILDRFIEYSESDRTTAAPDLRTYAHIITHYSRSRAIDGPYRAEYVLNRLVNDFRDQKDEGGFNSGNIKLKPDVFVEVMRSYSFDKHPEAGKHAVRLLRLMEKLCKDYGVRSLAPDANMYNTVLHALASVTDVAEEDCVARAIQIFDKMSGESLRERQPTVKSYEYLLLAWSKSSRPDRVTEALKVFRELEQQAATRSGFFLGDRHYHYMLDVCASPNESPAAEIEAFRVAQQLMDELSRSKHTRHSSHTYASFISACCNLRIPQSVKLKRMEQAFRDCSEDGLVNGFVLKQFVEGAPTALARLILRGPPDEVTVEDLPFKWRRTKYPASRRAADPRQRS